MLGQPIGTLWSNIRARPTARSPPCRPHASVSLLQVSAAAAIGIYVFRRRTAGPAAPPAGTASAVEKVVTEETEEAATAAVEAEPAEPVFVEEPPEEVQTKEKLKIEENCKEESGNGGKAD